MTGDGLRVRNEFAEVELGLDHGGNAVRLRIRDVETGLVRAVDAYVLRSLVLAPEALLRELCRATLPEEG